MNRKLRYASRIIWNLIRLSVLKMRSLGKFKAPSIQLVSPMSSLRIEDGGSISIINSLNMESGSLLYAFGGNISINGAFINRNCTIVSKESISIGHGVTIGPGVCIFDHDHNIKKLDTSDPYISDPVVIDDDVWIGANAVILKGIKINRGAVVAAGAVVNNDVPANCIVGGVPAKVIRHLAD